MYSSNDFERLFIRYKAEALPSGESILSFCNRNKVPYNLFEKWYKDTRHRLVPVQVDGRPSAEPWFDPYSDMTTEEKSKLIIELMSSQKSDRERIDSLMDKLDRMTESQLAANEASTLLHGQLSELMNLLKDKEDAYRLLQSEKEALAEQLKVNRKTMYGSKSQKGISKKKDNKRSKEEDKDHFDGSPESISQVDE